MKQKTKYLGMIAITAIFAIATISGGVDEADAKLVRDKHVVLPELEPDVDLSLIQMTEPVKSTEVSVKTTKGYVEKSSDSDAVTYRVIYRIQNEGTTDVKNIMISVSSDIDSAEGKLSGWLDVKHSIVAVSVKAVDFSSINAKIVGYEI